MAKLILILNLVVIGLAFANPVRRMHYHVIDGVTYSSGYGNNPLPQPLEPKQHDPIFVDGLTHNQVCKKIMIRSIYPDISMKVPGHTVPVDEYYSIKKLFNKHSSLQIVQNNTVLETYTRQDVFNMMTIEDFNNFDDFVQFYFDDCN